VIWNRENMVKLSNTRHRWFLS